MDDKILQYAFLPFITPSEAEGRGDAEGRGVLVRKAGPNNQSKASPTKHFASIECILSEVATPRHLVAARHNSHNQSNIQPTEQTTTSLPPFFIAPYGGGGIAHLNKMPPF